MLIQIVASTCESSKCDLSQTLPLKTEKVWLPRVQEKLISSTEKLLK